MKKIAKYKKAHEMKKITALISVPPTAKTQGLRSRDTNKKTYPAKIIKMNTDMTPNK